MIRAALALLLIVTIVGGTVVGCKTNQGAREYIPGKGWKAVD